MSDGTGQAALTPTPVFPFPSSPCWQLPTEPPRVRTVASCGLSRFNTTH